MEQNNMIELNGVTKRLEGRLLYENITLTVQRGEIVGFVGSNGSGKSVLFKLICGLMRADEGTVYVNGERLGDKNDFPKDTGVLIDSPGYIELYSGFQNLKMIASILNKIDDKQIEETMKLVGLDPYNKTKVKNYSLGMKQKLGIAQAIMENQQLLILDEPFNGLDFKTIKELQQIIRRLNEEGKTILLTSHEHEYLEKLCNRMYMIDEGKVMPFTDEIKQKYFTL
ncbi:ABC transporter ATP-binding protein [Pontibacillus litoralis]|nr:ATP-binding cassette domain-containing protein [Pontibacillus litoralis]